ncbi:MAG: lipopolysaccharide heptosyltransferase family protein [Proteobacteria bacterium]|nr:lipopolysaccharide heptosyltransferase family protein [Pseudomonadota bacterium]
MSFGESGLAVPPRGAGFPPWMDVRVESPLDVGTTRKVLIVRTDHVGDLVLSTPFFETVRRNLPRSRITALVTPYLRQVLERNPSVDQITVIDRNDRAQGRDAVIRGLRDEGYDLCIALSPTMNSYAIARTVRARNRAGYIYSRRWVPRALSGMLLTHRAVFHIDALIEKGLTVPHEVDQTLWFARALGFSAEPVPLRVYPEPAQARAIWADLGVELAALTDGADWNAASRRDSAWLAVQLSQAWLRPPWSLEHFTDLLKSLRATITDARIVVVFGPGEADAGRELATASLPDDVHVRGNLSFSQWAGLLGGARIALSGDTGAVHVAAAMRTPVVAVYEDATYDLCSQQWSPWMVAHRKVRKGAPRNDTIPRIVDACADLWKPGR